MPVNLEAFKTLRLHLASQPEKAWDMKEICGTAYCLAGHAQVAQAGRQPDINCWDNSAVLLGLDEDAADHVFGGGWTCKDWNELAIGDALDYLDAAIAAADPYVTLQDQEEADADV